MKYKESEWSNAEGVVGGEVTLIRRNESLLNVAQQNYPYLFLVNLFFKDLNEDKIPDNTNEIQRADDTEEKLADMLQKDHEALFALTVTRDGARDLFFFLKEPVEEQILESKIELLEPSIDYNFDFITDPSWGPYHSLYST